MRNATLPELVTDLQSYMLCNGIRKAERDLLKPCNSLRNKCHCYGRIRQYHRSLDCLLLIETKQACSYSRELESRSLQLSLPNEN